VRLTPASGSVGGVRGCPIDDLSEVSRPTKFDLLERRSVALEQSLNALRLGLASCHCGKYCCMVGEQVRA
jgi:hypothetical protein